VQNDASAAIGLVDGSDFKIAFALGRPVHTFAGSSAGATAVYVNLVGDDECGVKADTELTDQVRVFLLIARQVLHEISGAGLGDGTQVGNRVFAAHANTVVFEGDGFSVLVEAHADFQFGATLQQLWLGQGFET